MIKNKSMETFLALLIRDIRVFKKRFIGRSIDSIVWVLSLVLIAHHIMPMFGVNNSQFGAFTLVGTLAVWGFFEMCTSIAMIIGDLEGNRSISYFLTLPIKQSLIFVEMAIASAYRSMVTSILILPTGALLLGDSFSLSSVDWIKFIIAFSVVNLFYGFLTLLIASKTPDLTFLGTIRMRILFPLWFLGGYQFTWKMLYAKSKILAYLTLLNPMIYVMEGIRSSVLGPEDYLPFWICMTALTALSALFGFIGIKHLLKRLDCI